MDQVSKDFNRQRGVKPGAMPSIGVLLPAQTQERPAEVHTDLTRGYQPALVRAARCDHAVGAAVTFNVFYNRLGTPTSSSVLKEGQTCESEERKFKAEYSQPSLILGVTSDLFVVLLNLRLASPVGQQTRKGSWCVVRESPPALAAA